MIGAFGEAYLCEPCQLRDDGSKLGIDQLPEIVSLLLRSWLRGEKILPPPFAKIQGNRGGEGAEDRACMGSVGGSR